MNSRTICDFSAPGNIWPDVERWAKAEGFDLIEEKGDLRRFQKGNGWIVLPTMLEIRQTDTNVHLEAWVYGSLFNRIVTLFLLPEEITIESGGVRALIPRSIARDSINNLLKHFGQQLIK